jgi:DDE superfamily endonuclease
MDMLNLPPAIITVLLPFTPLFQAQTWRKVPVLLIGTVLAPGKRTITAALRVMGLKDEVSYAKYHHVLNRAAWSPLAVAEGLLILLVKTFCPEEKPLVFGIDETIERRWGQKIAARGIYRDPVRSSESHFVKASGLRWISLMLLTRIPWAQHMWALPVMTALAPSERYYQQRGRRPKSLTERAQQMILQLRRWLPNRPIVIVGDNTYAALDLLAACQGVPQPVTMITRLRLDAALYEPAPPYAGMGRPRKKGKRLPTPQHYLASPDTSWTSVEMAWYDGQRRLMEIASGTAVWFHYGKTPVPIRWVLIRDPQEEYATVALLCTDPDIAPQPIVEWFVMRWQLEVTFEESRRHLGLETQRQWSDKAIARSTPLLLGLFSWVTLAAHALHSSTHPVVARQAAWYAKELPTFSDALALVRQQLWIALPTFQTSEKPPDMLKVSRSFFVSLIDTLCYAA